MKKTLLVSLLYLSLLIPGFTQPVVKHTGKLIIFHAGSLSVPMKELSSAFRKIHPGVEIFLESAGSVECARKITDLKKPCDIMASSDYTVIDNMLIPGYADWNIPFVSNEMCIVYTEKAKYSGSITPRNWFDILMRNDVVYGRSDPNTDPCGYRAVMTMQLAEKYYKKPGLTRILTSKDQNCIRPKEVDLIALLETHTVDYIFLYKSVAIQHKLKYVELPDEINLKNPGLSDLYHTAAVDINGKEPGKKVTMFGEPMIYGVTILKDAPNKTVAIAFAEFMLDAGKGMMILNRNGQPSVIPQKNKNFDKLPDQLKRFTLK